MIEREDHAASNIYTQDFDIQNRLIQVTQSVTTTVTTFDYDDTGQRTETIIEQPQDKKTIIRYPFPNYEVETRRVWGCLLYKLGSCISWGWITEDTITRSTYSAGGQAIATRVSGDPVSTNNGLFYFHSDHLGSATFMTHGNGHVNEGSKVADSTKFFTPFGEYRIQPPSPVDGITDRGFTGHKHNDDIGLIYMNARYYVGSIGRFASADTVVPNPGNPQYFNRFSYGYNNPIKYNDPTGHCGAEAAADPNDPYYVGYGEFIACREIRGQLEGILGFSIPGIWTLEQMNILQESIASLGDAYDFANMTSEQRQAAIADVAIYWASQVTDIEAIIRAIEFAYAIGASPDDIFAALGYEDDGVTGFALWTDHTPRTELGSDVQSALGDYGFHERWQPDVEEEQIHHLIFWMQVAYYNFTPWADIGNWAHEQCNNAACSPEDEALGVWAIHMGDLLSQGEISLLDLANRMRWSLIYGND